MEVFQNFCGLLIKYELWSRNFLPKKREWIIDATQNRFQPIVSEWHYYSVTLVMLPIWKSFVLRKFCRMICNCAWGFSTVNSRFKKVNFSSLKSRVVWFRKDLCSEPKNRSSKKMPYVGEFETWDLSSIESLLYYLTCQDIYIKKKNFVKTY